MAELCGLLATTRKNGRNTSISNIVNTQHSAGVLCEASSDRRDGSDGLRRSVARRGKCINIGENQVII